MRGLAGLVPLTLCLGLGACASTGPGAWDGWWQETILEGQGKLGGCVVADIDPLLPGNEIVAVGEDGGIHLLWLWNGVWHHRRPYTLEGEAIQCVAGDLIAGQGGEELIALGVATGVEDGGGRGRATAMGLTADRERWLKTYIESEALIHAGVLADLDPDAPGPELAYGGLFGEARLVGRGRPAVLGDLPGNAKGAAAGVGGVVFACDDGSLVRFRRGSGRWDQDLLARAPDALARVAATGDRVLFCGNDGVLRLWRGGEVRELFVGTARLRGAVIADLDPLSPGIEYATAGYDGGVVVVREAEGRPAFEVVGRDGDRLHHLAAGELPGLGMCLVACGYGGRVLVIGHGANAR